MPDSHPRIECARPSWVVRLLPGILCLTYLVGTVLVFFFGPWVYDIADPRPLVLFLVAVHVALAVGYVLGVRGDVLDARVVMPIGTVAFLGTALELLLLFPLSRQYTGSWIPNPFVADLGAAYSQSLALREQGTPWVNYVRMLVSPLLAAALPLCVFYWRRLSLPTRVLFVTSTVGVLCLYTSMGANAGAAHWMALFPWFVLASHLAGEHRLGRRGWLKAGAIQVSAVVLFSVSFAGAMSQRAGSFAVHGSIPGIGARLAPAPEVADANVSEGVAQRGVARIAFDGLAGYLSQGYYAVYLSLEQPFVPMYGVGNSMFLQRQAARLTGDERWLEQSYPVRIESSGWNAYGYWATIYPWIASDVGFPGTVLVMGVLGFLLGRVWCAVLGNRNPWAVALFGQLLILFYYVPGHNKIMQTGEGLSAFAVLLMGWIVVSRRRPGRPELEHAP